MYTITVGYHSNLLPFNWVVFVFPGVITDNTYGTMGLHCGSKGMSLKALNDPLIVVRIQREITLKRPPEFSYLSLPMHQ